MTETETEMEVEVGIGTETEKGIRIETGIGKRAGTTEVEMANATETRAEAETKGTEDIITDEQARNTMIIGDLRLLKTLVGHLGDVPRTCIQTGGEGTLRKIYLLILKDMMEDTVGVEGEKLAVTFWTGEYSESSNKYLHNDSSDVLLVGEYKEKMLL